MRLRSIDVQMLHLMEELASGRQEITSAIRSELNSLSGVISEAKSRSKGKNSMALSVEQDKGSKRQFGQVCRCNDWSLARVDVCFDHFYDRSICTSRNNKRSGE